MPDLSMCFNDTCPSRKWCYRRQATPNIYSQTYGCFEWDRKIGRCEYFMEISDDNTGHRN